MTREETNEKIRRDEYEGEKLINKFRFVVALIFILSVIIVSFLRRLSGLQHFPFRAYTFTSGFLVYSILLHFYIKRKNTLHSYFKYICVILDAFFISGAIWVGCTYPEISPPITFLSIEALFYMALIMAGSFRYSVPCAFFSGIFSGVCYLIVVM